MKSGQKKISAVLVEGVGNGASHWCKGQPCCASQPCGDRLCFSTKDLPKPLTREKPLKLLLAFFHEDQSSSGKTAAIAASTVPWQSSFLFLSQLTLTVYILKCCCIRNMASGKISSSSASN